MTGSRRTAGQVFWAGLSLCGYTYAAYPAMMALVGRRQKPERASSAVDLPSVSVIVAAHRESAVIADRIRNLMDSDFPLERLEVIIAVDADPETARIVGDAMKGYPPGQLRLLDDPVRQGKSQAVSRAAGQATGDILVFSDANNSYGSAALRNLVAAFDDPQVGVATGAKTVHGVGVAGEGLYWRYEDLIRRGESVLGCCTGVCGEILAVRRSLFEPIPEDVINDDFWLAMRVARQGHHVVYVPDAVSKEPRTRSLADEAVRRRRIAAGRYQALGRSAELLPLRRPLALWQIVSHKMLRLAVPIAFLTSTAAAVWSTLRPARRHGIVALGTPFGAAAVAAITLFAVAARSRRGRIGETLGFLWSSNKALLDGLWSYLAGDLNPRWARIDRSEAVAEPTA